MTPDPADNPVPPAPQEEGDSASGDEAQEIGAAPPELPRPVTPLVRRRAWSEPRVRFWLLSSAVLLFIGIGFIINGLMTRSREAWLIANGVKIIATVRMANQEYVKDRPQPPDSIVQLNFEWHGQLYESHVSTLPGRKAFIVTGMKLPIRVNPDNPDDWTWLDEPLPLLSRAIGGIITLPMAALALCWAALRRRSFLRTWREGTAIKALIVDTRSTAVAPRSRAVRVTPGDEADKRIFTVFLPRAQAHAEPGDSLYILRRPGLASSALAAAWFA